MRLGPRSLCLVLLLAVASHMATAQRGAETSVAIGVGGNIVVDAWNPVRLVTRDVPAGTSLFISIDTGSLRQGAIPVDVALNVPGGAGISVVESLVYVSPFSSISWSLRGPEAVMASGSLAGRDQDARPLDLVLSRDPGRYASAFGSGTRVVDVAAAALPIEVAAYDGVRTVIIDGTTTAPRLEAVAAAAAAGVVVVLHGDLPASHRELLLLADGASTRLGAGAVLSTRGAASDAVAAALAFQVPDRDALLTALTQRSLVERPVGPTQYLVLIAAGLFGVLVLTMLRWFGAPGVVGATMVALLVSFVAWRAFRPEEAQLTGAVRLAMVGGELTAATEVREVLTLPASVVEAPAGARPLLPQAYQLDQSGTSFKVQRWRSVTLVLAPVVAAPGLQVQGSSITNAGTMPLHDITVIGLGPQPDLAPGRTAELVAAEDGLPSPVYAALLPHLPHGTVVGVSDCMSACTVWVAPAAFDDLGGPL